MNGPSLAISVLATFCALSSHSLMFTIIISAQRLFFLLLNSINQYRLIQSIEQQNERYSRARYSKRHFLIFAYHIGGEYQSIVTFSADSYCIFAPFLC